MHSERLQLNDTAADVIVKLSEGNPGAVSVLADIFRMGATIDPDAFLGGLDAPLHLDSLGIYGPRIWMLYNDVCRGKIVETIGMIRACQLGFVSRATLLHAIDNRGAGLDVVGLMAQVRDQLPRFGTANVPAESVVETSTAVGGG